MTATIKTRIVKIGNSQGIRIPKILLDQTGIESEVELEVQDNQLVLRAVQKVRQGWDLAFATMSAHQDDRLLDTVYLTEWDQLEWEW